MLFPGGHGILDATKYGKRTSYKFADRRERLYEPPFEKALLWVSVRVCPRRRSFFMSLGKKRDPCPGERCFVWRLLF